jgi:hypothetical protein
MKPVCFAFSRAPYAQTYDEARMNLTSLEKKRARDARYRDRNREAKRERDRARRERLSADPAWVERERKRKRAYHSDPLWAAIWAAAKRAARERNAVDPHKLLDLRVDAQGKCRFIPGQTAGPDTRFCAEPVEYVGGSYCGQHMKIVYVVPPAAALEARSA